MLDADLAALYGVSPKRSNEQLKFRLTFAQKAKVAAICDHLRRPRFSPGFDRWTTRDAFGERFHRDRR